jgi:hypothetical protein
VGGFVAMKIGASSLSLDRSMTRGPKRAVFGFCQEGRNLFFNKRSTNK